MTDNQQNSPYFENSTSNIREIKLTAAQLRAVYDAFKIKPSTMLMVSHLTGIERANICRYVDTLKKHERIQCLKYAYCEISKYKAGYYSTDEALFKPILKQLTLF